MNNHLIKKNLSNHHNSRKKSKEFNVTHTLFDMLRNITIVETMSIMSKETKRNKLAFRHGTLQKDQFDL